MRLTLEETWKQCRAMWKWIKKRRLAGDARNVEELKADWSEDHGFGDADIVFHCFFCHHNENFGGNSPDDCHLCPAKTIDPDFHCFKHASHHFELWPVNFADEIARLDRIRKRKKKSK